MSSVGGIACDFVKGTAALSLRERTEVWQVHGIDGYGALRIGGGNAEFRFSAVKYGTETAVAAWITSLEALQGTIISVIDDRGRNHTSLLLIVVGQPGITAELGNGGYRAELMLDGVKFQ